MADGTMADPISLPAPQSIAEVEHLIQQLYSPLPPDVLGRINAQLMALQTSEDGWQMADQLMASQDSNVRFYAALTFIVKLNNDGPSLDEDTATTVLARLISWLVRCINQQEKALVTKKLCVALITYYIRSKTFWHQPLLHVALSFQHGDAVPTQAVQDHTGSISTIIPSLNEQQLQALIWLSGTFAEEITKLPARTQEFSKHHDEMETTIKDASEIMLKAFDQASSSGTRSETLQTYVSWINYTQYVWRGNQAIADYLHVLFEPASACLFDEELATEALDHFRDIIDSYASFFRREDMTVLARFIRDRLQPKLLGISDGSDAEDVVPMIQFVVAFGCGNIQQVIEQPNNELIAGGVVGLLLQVLTMSGVPGDTDQTTVHTIEFWNTYIEYVNDLVYAQDPDGPALSWLPQAEAVLGNVVELFWRKLWIPTTQELQAWDEGEHDTFKEFRMDANELMVSILILLQQRMLQQIVAFTLQALAEKEWRAVEAGLFVLNTCADNVAEGSWGDELIGAVFQSDLFIHVANFDEAMPTQTRKTAIDTIGSYGEFIERHPEFLPNTVRFLFASLEKATFANISAKSIDSLCSNCRSNLTSELPGFLAHYKVFLKSPSCEPYTKQKVISGIAAIIQAVKPESSKAAPLLDLLANIDDDVKYAQGYADRGQVEDAEMARIYGVSALECLHYVGKSMQVPDDVPINLYEEDEPTGADNFWRSEAGTAVQSRIINIIFDALKVVGDQSEAIDAAAQTLRTGRTETQPGPFVFPTSVTVRFLECCSVNTPSLDSVLLVVGQAVSDKTHPITPSELTAIYTIMAQFMHTLGKSTTDQSVASGCIEVLNRFLPHHAATLFDHLSPEILDFTLSAIDGRETFPKKSACAFWTKLISPQGGNISTNTQTRINHVMQAYGEKFTTSLLGQFGGHALRSDLDFLCDPLKALLLHQSGTLAWLQRGLESPEFPAQHIKMEARAMFLQRIMAARSDGKKVRETAKQFWANCRGTVASFSS